MNGAKLRFQIPNVPPYDEGEPPKPILEGVMQEVNDDGWIQVLVKDWEVRKRNDGSEYKVLVEKNYNIKREWIKA